MGFFRDRRFNKNPELNFEEGTKQDSSDLHETKVFSSVKSNYNFLNSFFKNGIGLVISNYEITDKHIPVCLAYIESIADIQMIRKHVVIPLLNCNDISEFNNENILSHLQTRVLSSTNTFSTNKMQYIIERLLNGDTVLFLENTVCAIIIGSRNVEKRAVTGPENEGTVLSSQESFTDDLKTNLSLIIKRLPVPNLIFEEYIVGKLSRTKVKLIWLDNIADTDTIEEARNRIKKIDIDTVDGIGALGELIEDKPFSIFPKFRQTERPDMVSRSLTEGRFAILCSNSPFALVAPISFWDNFKNMDDYQERSLSSSYLRLIRFFAFFLAILVSALYLSFISFNQAIVPPSLAVHIASGRSGVPFPSVFEVFILTFGVSIIREAGVRMPGSVGYFVGTLAAVVIGTAIVNAGYVSDSVIIIVAVATISGFALSTTLLLQPARLINLFLLLLTSFFGMFGLVNGLVFLFWYVSTLDSFGISYLYPLVPFDWQGFKDIFFRPPYPLLNKRTRLLSPINITRSGKKVK